MLHATLKHVDGVQPVGLFELAHNEILDINQLLLCIELVVVAVFLWKVIEQLVHVLSVDLLESIISTAIKSVPNPRLANEMRTLIRVPFIK